MEVCLHVSTQTACPALARGCAEHGLQRNGAENRGEFGTQRRAGSPPEEAAREALRCPPPPCRGCR